MGSALVIETDGSVRDTVLPVGAEERRAAIRELVGGYADQGRYHPEVLLHVASDGSPQPNLLAWALASAWRGLDIPYLLYGTVVVTSAVGGADLPPGMASHVHAAGEAVSVIAWEWRSRRPASDEAARAELIAGVRHSLSSVA
ncbi:hypothetical protein [Streptacidiphilus jiangxiensis]|uniref:Uncharacterized protein n=1 Tax=Streptacidiphilus jiangxiensis TaxID=235985 RepID=A0A1H8B7H4_STRJI|nr:hypothetical protein [Streptacidiphilus jiangxiensis]SEM78900.1 hypothetical protein SAMN05414137_1593 [Streptacidiphilus jiangxiensis]